MKNYEKETKEHYKDLKVAESYQHLQRFCPSYKREQDNRSTRPGSADNRNRPRQAIFAGCLQG